MGFQQDWVLRQIEALVQFVSKVVFKKEFIQYEIMDEANLSHTDLLYGKLKKLLAEQKICEAENMLFEKFEENNHEFLKLAIDFYQTINQMRDEELESHDFSREEINDGLKEVLCRYGISLPG